MRMLVVEDNPEILESISLVFQIGCPEVQLSSTHMGARGLELARNDAPDIIILDLSVLDMNGFEVLEKMRDLTVAPIIVLTVREEEDRITAALKRGADDCIVKPCGQTELLVRVKARMNDRVYFSQHRPISFGLLNFNPAKRRLVSGISETEVNWIEGHILGCLMRRRGNIETYFNLIRDIWGSDFPSSRDSLRVHIACLQSKIKATLNTPKLIFNRPSVGYYLSELV